MKAGYYIVHFIDEETGHWEAVQATWPTILGSYLALPTGPAPAYAQRDDKGPRHKQTQGGKQRT